MQWKSRCFYQERYMRHLYLINTICYIEALGLTLMSWNSLRTKISFENNAAHLGIFFFFSFGIWRKFPTYSSHPANLSLAFVMFYSVKSTYRMSTTCKGHQRLFIQILPMRDWARFSFCQRLPGVLKEFYGIKGVLSFKTVLDWWVSFVDEVFS